MALDVRYQTWMGFKQKVGDVYFFEIRLCLYIELVNYPLIQIGVSRIPNDPAFLYTLAKALKEVPLLIPELTVFPLLTGLDDWDCPEDLKLDLITAPAYVSGADYIALSVFPWTTPSFWMALAAYIPVVDANTAIPSSVTDKDKFEVEDPDGTVFMPEKSQWYEQDDTIAIYTTFYNRTDAFFDGAFVWEGIDISSETPPHIWWTYTDVDPWIERPQVQRASSWSISLAPSTVRGFENYYDSWSGNYALYQTRWKITLPVMTFEFYPAVEEDTGGGGHIPIAQGVSLLGLLGLPPGAAGGLNPMGGVDIFRFFKGG